MCGIVAMFSRSSPVSPRCYRGPRGDYTIAALTDNGIGFRRMGK
jgi:hypothetical protein